MRLWWRTSDLQPCSPL
uniref:Uncharacterized protein n=1 Tax=Anguilla anguilla TaxID=7936 RepID=A0A0E9TFL6_ANGAN